MRKRPSSFRARVSILIAVFFAAVFSVPAFRTGDAGLWTLAAAVPGAMLLMLLLPSRIIRLDRPSLSAAMVLCGFGIMAPAMADPGAAVTQALYSAGSLLFFFVAAVLVRSSRPSVPAGASFAVAALGLASCPLWLDGSIEFATGGTALLLVAVTVFLSLRQYLPSLCISLLGVLLFLLSHSIAPALVWGVACILVFWAASGSGVWTTVSFASISALIASWIGFFPLSAETAAESSLSRLVGLPLLAPDVPHEPGSVTGPLFFLLAEHCGLVFLLFVLLLVCILLLRGASLAGSARRMFHASLALGAMLLFGLRCLLFMGSLFGALPFPAAGIPFLSGSVPQLCSDFFLLGLLSGVSARNEADLEEDTRLSMFAR